MGLFKDSIKFKEFTYLTELGFLRDRGPRGEEGYIKTISHDENEVLWITIDPNHMKVYLYNEWECGGKLWDKTLDIPEEYLYDKDKFIDWLDNHI